MRTTRRTLLQSAAAAVGAERGTDAWFAIRFGRSEYGIFDAFPDAAARDAAARLLECDPAFTISSWIARGGQTSAKLQIEGLRKVGLPE